MIRAMWLSTVRRSMTEVGGDRGVRTALGHQLQHLSFACAEPVELVGQTGVAHQVRDHRRVEHGAAGKDGVHRLDQHVDIDHPVLEQVAEPLRVGTHQVHDVPALQGLGQQQDAELGVPLAQLDRGARALVGVGRRHPDVDHGEVGPVFVDGRDQINGVPDRCDHLGAGLRQQSS